jgi:hypothetical protein
MFMKGSTVVAMLVTAALVSASNASLAKGPLRVDATYGTYNVGGASVSGYRVDGAYAVNENIELRAGYESAQDLTITRYGLGYRTGLSATTDLALNLHVRNDTVLATSTTGYEVEGGLYFFPTQGLAADVTAGYVNRSNGSTGVMYGARASYALGDGTSLVAAWRADASYANTVSSFTFGVRIRQ